MTPLEPKGHRYLLDHIDGDGNTGFQFVTRFRGEQNREGPQCQEVLRMLIDRVCVLNQEVEWEGNRQLLWHLRMALVYFEARALIRKVEKMEMIQVENIPVGDDGHWELYTGQPRD